MARSDPIEHVVIDDFRSGIVSSLRSIQQQGILDLPPGTATEGTVGCIANATGQLVPLPEGSPYYEYPPPNQETTGPGAHLVSLAGLSVSGPMTSTFLAISNDYVHVYYHQITPGIPHLFDAFEWDVIKPDGSLVTVCNLTGQPGTTVLGTEIPPPLTKRGITHAFTRTRASTFSSPGFPVTAAETTLRGPGSVGPWENGAFQKYIIYPNTTALTTDTPFTQVGTVNNATFVLGGQLIAHSGRLLRLCESAVGHGASFNLETNERIRFTDPPNSQSLTSTAQDSIFDAQYPGGYGSWGSISFGELLLVKRYGGALLVEGDVYAPSITRLPGVASTGDLMNAASWCAAGLVYCVENDGAYLWNGGNTSRKINKINDTFYEGVDAGGGGTSGSVPPDFGCKTDHTSWNNLVIFTSGWAYDAANDAWWRLANPHTVGHIQWLAAGIGTSSYLYTIPAGLNASNNIEVAVFDAASPGRNYTWISQPIPATHNKTVDIAEIELSFSNVLASTTVNVAVWGLDSALSVLDTVTLPGFGTGPFRIRLPVGQRSNGIQVAVQVAGLIRAPTLNSIIIGYRLAGPMGQGV